MARKRKRKAGLGGATTDHDRRFESAARNTAGWAASIETEVAEGNCRSAVKLFGVADRAIGNALAELEYISYPKEGRARLERLSDRLEASRRQTLENCLRKR